MHPYFYPDENDAITSRLIQSNADPQNWADDEQRVLLNLAERILTLEPPRSVLDIGAGLGRVIVQLHTSFHRGTLVEPDDLRRKGLTELCRLIGPPASGYEVLDSIDSLDVQATYEVILISHVIQHVPDSLTRRLIEESCSRVRQGGFVYLATCTSGTRTEEFRLNEFDENSHWRETLITNERFEELASRSVEGQLPVRFFPVGELSARFEDAGLSVLEILPFHFRIDHLSGDFRPRDVALIARRN